MGHRMINGLLDLIRVRISTFKKDFLILNIDLVQKTTRHNMCTTRVQHDTTRHNTSKTRVQHDITRVRHNTTRDNTSTIRYKPSLTRPNMSTKEVRQTKIWLYFELFVTEFIFS